MGRRRSRPRDTEDCGQAALDILGGRRPRRHTDAHRGMTLPNRAAAPTRAFVLDSPDHLAGAFGIPERHQYLVEYNFIEHGVTSSSEAVGEPGRVLAGA